MTPVTVELDPVSGRDQSQTYLGRFCQDRFAIAAALFICFFLIVVAVGPMFIPYGFSEQDLAARSAAPSMAHWLGTDDLGRDLLARVVFGGRTALVISVVVTFISVLIGVALGALAGYRGGWLDQAIMWFADITMSVPALLLVVVINVSANRLSRR